MARVFTIRFPFKGQTLSAVVSLKQESYDMSFLICYMEDDVREVIPGRRVVLSLSEGIKSPKELTRYAEDLVSHTSEAITKHLQLQ